MVFDGVVGATDERLGNLGPPVAELVVGEDQLAVLVAAPLLALDLGVEVVVPALAALLADAPRKLLRNLGPLLSAQLADELDDLGILLRRPRAFDELGVENLLPAVQALDVRALLEVLGCWMECREVGAGDDGQFEISKFSKGRAEREGAFESAVGRRVREGA